MNSHTFALLLSVFLGALIVGCGSPEEEIIKNGAAEIPIKWNKSQLLSAIERSDTELAIELINKGEDVNEKERLLFIKEAKMIAGVRAEFVVLL